MADLLLACYGRPDRPSFPGTGSPVKPGMTTSKPGMAVRQCAVIDNCLIINSFPKRASSNWRD